MQLDHWPVEFLPAFASARARTVDEPPRPEDVLVGFGRRLKSLFYRGGKS
jgi:hypothetical protein